MYRDRFEINPARFSGAHPTRGQEVKWNPGSKFWIYFGVILVYLTLISIVVVVIVLMLPKYGHDTTSSKIPIRGQNPPLKNKPPPPPPLLTGVGAIDPRNDLPTPTGPEEGSSEVRNRTNSKFLDLDKLEE